MWGATCGSIMMGHLPFWTGCMWAFQQIFPISLDRSWWTGSSAPRSSYLSSCCIFLWGALKSIVYHKPFWVSIGTRGKTRLSSCYNERNSRWVWPCPATPLNFCCYIVETHCIILPFFTFFIFSSFLNIRKERSPVTKNTFTGMTSLVNFFFRIEKSYFVRLFWNYLCFMFLYLL